MMNIRKRIPVLAVGLALASLVMSPAATSAGEGVPQRLDRIEELLAKVYLLLQEPSPAPENRTRLLFPFVSNQAGFDAGLAIANTGKDSSGVVGVAGNCTVYYFGSTANGGAAPEPETTTVPVSPGETFTFVLSSGGAKGIRGAPNFQGYIEVDCAFPFAHGFALLTDGPIGQAKVGTTVPALVLPRKRTNAEVESVGQ